MNKKKKKKNTERWEKRVLFIFRIYEMYRSVLVNVAIHIVLIKHHRPKEKMEKKNEFIIYYNVGCGKCKMKKKSCTF